MKFLIDENISKRIIPLIESSLSEFYHILFPDLISPISDHSIWKYAKEKEFNIITKDEDFIKLSMLFGTPLKVILLNVGNLNTSELAKVLIKNEQVIHQFVNHEEYGFLAIKQ